MRITEGTKRIVAGIVLAWAIALAAQGQRVSDQPNFAVVSIHPVPSNAPFMAFERGFTPVRPGGQYVNPRASLGGIINLAYGIGNPVVRLLGMPEWARHQLYDVVAKPDEGFPVLSQAENLARVRLMLRGMLAERFGLQIHSENRSGRVLTMEVAKDGIKMKEVTDLPDPTAVGYVGAAWGDADGRLISKGCAMSALANVLSTSLKRPVLDRTGLTGFYAFDISWDEPAPSSPAEQPTSGPGAVGLSLLLSNAERLGLKFKDANGSVEYWIVDQLKQPTPN
jgi:uncharacterized protein (TIGR03435 family)